MFLKNIKIKKRGLPSISEGRSLVPCFAAISVCVFCELGPKKISFLGDQPTKKKRRARGRPQKSIIQSARPSSSRF